MRLAIVLETNEPERVWNAFRLANKTLAGQVCEHSDQETQRSARLSNWPI